jgi:hypothetical protein
MGERIMLGKLSAGIVIIVAVILLTGFLTDELRANWKYAGGTLLEKEGGHALAFFDADNIQYLSNGDVKVWVKAINASEIDRVVTKEKEIVKKAAEKMEKPYYPPYFLSNPNPDTSADTYLEMIVWEEAANHADIKPMARLLYEINCKERMFQTISAITYKSDGSMTFTSDFDKWNHITQASTGDNLAKLLCK